MMNMHCPRCQNPQTLKATSIINSGNSMSITNGSAVGVGVIGGIGGIGMSNYASSTYAQSMLASKLRPPLPPRKISPTGAIALLIVSICLAAVLSCPLSALLASPVTTIITYGDNHSSSCMGNGQPDYCNSISHTQYVDQHPMIYILEAIMGGCAAGFIGSLVWMIASAPRRKAIYMERLARWQRAMYNWDQAYYCNVCDSIYLQTTRQFTSLATMHSLLFSV